MLLIPLVAAGCVHWDNGWLAIAPHSAESSQRLQDLLSWLQVHHPDRYKTATQLGRPVMLNNGIEFAATYFILLLILFFHGAGKYLSLDYYISRYCCKRGTKAS